MGPRASAGMNVSAPTMRTSPTSIETNNRMTAAMMVKY